MIDQCSEYRDIQDKFIKLCGSSRHLAAGVQTIRVDEQQLIEQLTVAGTGHQRKGRSAAAGGHISPPPDHRPDKVRDHLDIEIIGIGHIRFFRTTASQKVDVIYGVILAQGMDELLPLIAAGDRGQVMD